jgi:transposase-like protein
VLYYIYENLMKTQEKKKAIRLRKSGESIKVIAKHLGVSKSSVSVWVRDIELTHSQKSKLNERGFSVNAIEKRRKQRIENTNKRKERIMEEAEKEIRSISISELKIIGTMLYWAEGRKRGKQIVDFSNSDPVMIKVMMRFFREVCGVSEKRFRGHIHIHSHLKVKQAENYWSKISGIPISQFYKTYSKPSVSSKGKMDSLPYGTFDIYVCDTELFLKIMGWIRKTSKLMTN